MSDYLARVGLVLLAGTAVIGIVVSGGPAPLALFAVALAFAPIERLRKQLSFAGHQVPPLAVFSVGAAAALAALFVLVTR